MREVVRDADGQFHSRLSPAVAAGNWLPIAPAGYFKLELRLYDTPLTTGSQLAALTMPTIQKVACP